MQFLSEERTLALSPAHMMIKPTCGWEIGLVPFSMLATEEEVRGLAEEYGAVVGSRLTLKGVCVIQMHRKEGAQMVLMDAKRRQLHGKSIKAFWSQRARREVPELEEHPVPDLEEHPGKVPTTLPVGTIIRPSRVNPGVSPVRLG